MFCIFHHFFYNYHIFDIFKYSYYEWLNHIFTAITNTYNDLEIPEFFKSRVTKKKEKLKKSVMIEFH